MATDPLDRTVTFRDLIAVLDKTIAQPLLSLLAHDQLMKSELTKRLTAAGQRRLAYRCLSCGAIISDQLPHTITNPGKPATSCPAAGWVTLTITVTP
jgi:hypothetical protein